MEQGIDQRELDRAVQLFHSICRQTLQERFPGRKGCVGHKSRHTGEILRFLRVCVLTGQLFDQVCPGRDRHPEKISRNVVIAVGIL